MMRNGFAIVLGLAGILISGACSTREGSTNALVNVASQDAGTNASGSSGPANSNTSLVANGAVVLPQSVNANVVSTESADPLRPEQMSGKFDQLRKDGGDSKFPDPAALAAKIAKPAPDNSTFAVFLTDAGHEIRTFKNNPQILRVEKRIENNGDQSLKVYLRNGNVVQLPGKSIPTLSTASADSIASAAGLAAAPVKAPAPGSSGTKKPSN